MRHGTNRALLRIACQRGPALLVRSAGHRWRCEQAVSASLAACQKSTRFCRLDAKRHSRPDQKRSRSRVRFSPKATVAVTARATTRWLSPTMQSDSPDASVGAGRSWQLNEEQPCGSTTFVAPLRERPVANRPSRASQPCVGVRDQPSNETDRLRLRWSYVGATVGVLGRAPRGHH